MLVAQSHVSSPAAPRRARSRGALLDGVVLLALLALCLGLRVANPLGLPIFFDEAEYTRVAQIVGAFPGPATWLMSLHDGTLPLFTWLAAPLTRLVADPLLAARLTSAIIGTLALPFLWSIGRLLWGRGGAYLAALLYALCPFVLFYNRLALLDGLVTTCGAAALLFALRLSQQARRGDGLALGLCLAAGMLTKIFAVSMLLLPLLAIAAAHPAERRRVRPAALLSMALCLLPLVALLLTRDGAGLLSAFHAHAHVSVDIRRVVARQLGAWLSACWLYFTPPIVVLALLGGWTMRRERAGWIVGPWALLGGLPPVLIPSAFLAPRYFLYMAVPVILLATAGLLTIYTTLRAGRRALAWVAALPAIMLAVLPALSADAAIIGAPRTAPLTAFDRWQYVTGWPSGYALMPVVAYLRAQERRGPIAVVTSIYNPPGDALSVLLGRDRNVALANVDFAALPRHPLHTSSGRRVFLIACRPYGQPLRSARSLRLVLHAPNADGDGGDDLYVVMAR